MSVTLAGAVRCSLMSGELESDGFVEICEKHIRGYCTKQSGAEEHRLVHTNLPYIWQILETDKSYVSLPPDCGYALESAFCALADCYVFHIANVDGLITEVSVDFDAMLAKCVRYTCASTALCQMNPPLFSCVKPVRRLSTCSFVASTAVPTDQYVTQWRWQYLDGKMWKCFGEISAIPSQAVLESKFLSGRQSLYMFEVASEGEYLIKLLSDASGAPIMRRMSNGTEWRVRRRPLLVTPEHIAKRVCHPFPKINAVMFAESVPTDWTPVDTEQEVELVPMNPESMAYHLVASEFEKTLPRNERRICDIFRVQNSYLWHKYHIKKMMMARNGKPLNETQLFHGTRDAAVVRAITRQNFDWRLSGSANAEVYGSGAYFAVSAALSDKYAYKPKHVRNWMFLVRTILGATALGKQGYTRPPPINASNPQAGLYDSCTNSVANSTIYVLFDDDQYYPEYLISYTDCRL